MIKPDVGEERVAEASSSFNSEMNNFLEMEEPKKEPQMQQISEEKKNGTIDDPILLEVLDIVPCAVATFNQSDVAKIAQLDLGHKPASDSQSHHLPSRITLTQNQKRQAFPIGPLCLCQRLGLFGINMCRC